MGITAELISLPESVVQEIVSNPELIYEHFFESPHVNGEVCKVDLDKTWHAVHVLLCGSDEADGSILGGVVLGGNAIDLEMDYGEPKYHSNTDVKRISKELEQIDLTHCFEQSKHLLTTLEDVYCGAEIAEEGIDSIKGFFKELIRVYEHASANGNGIVTVLV